ncbi:MAG: response regulator transcription factor [Opitutaceae bacterium]|nr:response regulator transcription factor [Opitutaceae bacterium]
MIVEDDPVYRQFVRQILKKVEGVTVIGECSTGAEGIAICRREKPDAMLLDLVLPDQQGVDVVRTLRPEFPDMIVLLMTAHPRDDLPRELLKLGVQGFADKTATAPELVKSIRSVLAGGLSYTSVAGSKEVAAKLGLSTRTVEKHRANIYAKLGVRDVVGLTRWCLYHGMVI